jgi:tRNA(Ile)-lysidine synthase
MKPAIYAFIQRHNLIQKNSTLIVALSGGPDSVFLLHVLNELKAAYNLTLIAAYLDHGWRTDTAADRALCQELCDTLNITFEWGHAKDLGYTPPNKGSLEDQARALRRFYFRQLKDKHKADAIALGHHQDDQMETFLIRLSRGTSLAGLCSMRPGSNEYIRPLLETSKKDILTYLHTHDIPYRIDSTNESDAFLRNRLRKTAIPALQACDARIISNTLRTISHLQEAYNALSDSIEQKKIALIAICDSNGTIINIDKLTQELPFFQKEIVTAWIIERKVTCMLSESLINEILRFLCSPRGGTHCIHPSWSIVKKHKKAYIINHS